MSSIRKFEDLIAWQKARVLAREIYQASSCGQFARDFGLCDQIRRAAVSIASNVAEGFERGTNAEFHHYLSIARSSCAEVRTQLYIAVDVGHLEETEFQRLSNLAAEVARVIGGLRTSVRERKKLKY